MRVIRLKVGHRRWSDHDDIGQAPFRAASLRPLATDDCSDLHVRVWPAAHPPPTVRGHRDPDWIWVNDFTDHIGWLAGDTEVRPFAAEVLFVFRGSTAVSEIDREQFLARAPHAHRLEAQSARELSIAREAMRCLEFAQWLQAP
jgi:hypothetical protein